MIKLSSSEAIEQLTIEGYASRFYEADLNDDMVVPGAFRSSLIRSGSQGVRMLYQHQPKAPIGVWDQMLEDDTGLYVRGRVLEASPEGHMVASLIRAGAIDGLSIGFRTQKSRRDLSGRLRVLTEVELWEVSIVTFPMLRSARLQAVRPALAA